jgi:hypothetical protein
VCERSYAEAKSTRCALVIGENSSHISLVLVTRPRHLQNDTGMCSCLTKSGFLTNVRCDAGGWRGRGAETGGERERRARIRIDRERNGWYCVPPLFNP